MQRRTNEWYQGLREASSEEEDEEDIITELETSFMHNKTVRVDVPNGPRLVGSNNSGSSSNSEGSSVRGRTVSRSPGDIPVSGGGVMVARGGVPVAGEVTVAAIEAVSHNSSS